MKINLVYEWYEVQADKARDLCYETKLDVLKMSGSTQVSPALHMERQSLKRSHPATGHAAVLKVAQRCTKFHRALPRGG